MFQLPHKPWISRSRNKEPSSSASGITQSCKLTVLSSNPNAVHNILSFLLFCCISNTFLQGEKELLSLLPSSHDRMEQISHKAHDHFSKSQPLHKGLGHVSTVVELQPPPATYIHQPEMDKTPCSTSYFLKWGSVHTDGAVLHPAQQNEKQVLFVFNDSLVNES